MDLRLLRYFVTVAEERHFGRAAARLHMTQPPLSRAIKHLETELGGVLLERSPSGVTLTAVGAVLFHEARDLLEHAEQARTRVAAAAGTATITIGVLADSAEQAGAQLADAFRERHPAVHVQIREADLTDPTAGLRAGLVDLALTRTPFEDAGIRIYPLRTDPVGVILRTDDPLARRESLLLRDLADRRWFRLPDGDPIWRSYWNATSPGGPLRDGPVVRTIHECLQAVLWNGTIGLTPLPHSRLPAELTTVPLDDMPPSQLVLAWNETATNPLIRSFVGIASTIFDQPVRRHPLGTALRQQ